jgi:Mrp family chromosome partitioning ATPase
MSRMLEALKQIEARSPGTRPTVQPLAPEELEALGLEPSPPPDSAQPGKEEAPEEAAAPGGPDKEDASAQQPEPPAADAAVSDQSPEAPAARESDPQVRRLLSPLDEAHQEPYGELARSILEQLTPRHPAVLLFTSPDDGAGKTGMLAALGVALSEEAAEEVIVVDANLRSPALANEFGIWADEGLVEVLTGEKGWRDVVRKTSAKHLCVLPGGRFPDDAALPEDNKLASLLEALRRAHRLVLVDTASLQYPEVAPLSGLCDGTYLVIALGQTERNAARQAARLIKRCGGRVLGCVLTNAEPES